MFQSGHKSWPLKNVIYVFTYLSIYSFTRIYLFIHFLYMSLFKKYILNPNEDGKTNKPTINIIHLLDTYIYTHIQTDRMTDTQTDIDRKMDNVPSQLLSVLYIYKKRRQHLRRSCRQIFYIKKSRRELTHHSFNLRPLIQFLFIGQFRH